MAAPEIASNQKVTVASKLPFPLVLQLQQPQTHTQVVAGEQKKYVLHHHLGKRYILKGSAFRSERGPRGQYEGGHTLTPNIPADFWAGWLEQNKDSDFITGGWVFGPEALNGKHADVAGKARERKNELCGLEPLNPSKLPPDFQRKSAKVETMESD